MRIWDVPPAILCRQHLLGEHRELHALWTILTENKNGYRNHPETKRWAGKEKALFLRHEEEVREMQKRGYAHHSPLDGTLATGSHRQEVYVDSPKKQKEILRSKPCSCP
jgi:hypothetical protein